MQDYASYAAGLPAAVTVRQKEVSRDEFGPGDWVIAWVTPVRGPSYSVRATKWFPANPIPLRRNVTHEGFALRFPAQRAGSTE
jgi:hypothetical protein